MNIQEAYRTPNRLDQKRNSPCHIIIKTPNALNKERILKAARKKGQVTYKDRPMRITPDFSPEMMKARRSWVDLMQTLSEKSGVILIGLPLHVTWPFSVTAFNILSLFSTFVSISV